MMTGTTVIAVIMIFLRRDKFFINFADNFVRVFLIHVIQGTSFVQFVAKNLMLQDFTIYLIILINILTL